MKSLWIDESGAVLSVELMLITVLLVFGVGVGLVALRDAVASKLAGVADAIANLDTAYTITGLTYTSPFTTTGGGGTNGVSFTGTTVYTGLTNDFSFAPLVVLSSTPAP
jgi:hypothetical protein